MRNPFQGYDQWKTASPYDGDEMPVIDDGVPDFPVICPHCQELAEFHREEYIDDSIMTEPEVMERWHCEECDWEQEVMLEDYDRIKPKLYQIEIANAHARMNRAHNNAVKPEVVRTVNIEDLSLPEGDFDWSDIEAGESHAYCCGEKDCPVQWHTYAPWTAIKRVNGILEIEMGSVDSDGNSDTDSFWSDNPDEDNGPFGESGVAWSMSRESHEYFYGWAQYWLHCASSMSDVLEQSFKGPYQMTPAQWIEFCIKAAVNNIKYMENENEHQR